MDSVDLDSIRADWSVLDDCFSAGRITCHEVFTQVPSIQQNLVTLPFRLRSVPGSRYLHALLLAVFLIVRSKDSPILVNGGALVWIFVGLINRYACRNSKCVIVYDYFAETASRLRIRAIVSATRGVDAVLLWSKDQIAGHASHTGLDERYFYFIPYKANHSKTCDRSVPRGGFVFAGGNGKRDYELLVEATRGTDMLVLVSATDPTVRNAIPDTNNVIPIGAWEPSFEKLQIASRFVVIPMVYTGVKGGGEANFCNAMWNGRAIVAADSIAAKDYIDDGETGFVVPAGDAQALRTRMLELWNQPDVADEMGRMGRIKVEKTFTHELFVRRLMVFSLIVAKSKKARD